MRPLCEAGAFFWAMGCVSAVGSMSRGYALMGRLRRVIESRSIGVSSLLSLLDRREMGSVHAQVPPHCPHLRQCASMEGWDSHVEEGGSG
jgi:hypothetical protein